MSKVIAVHSNRGGVGKTSISVNLAAAFAAANKNVFLADLDFRAPDLYAIFNERPRRWINDFLNDRCRLDEIILDLTEKYRTEGSFLVGLADPALDSVRDMASKDKRWEMRSLQRILSLTRELFDNETEYVIFDTSPGVLYSSVNAVASSDEVIIVTTLDTLDVWGTQRILKELYSAFNKRTYLLVNKFLPQFQWKEEERDVYSKGLFTQFSIPILAVIPCYCDMLNASRRKIYALENAEHPFAKTIREIVQKL